MGHYIPHHDLKCYPKCFRCNKGSGWHLPTEEEISGRLKYRRSRSPSGNHTLMEEIITPPPPDMDLVCLAGPCQNANVRCDGFAVDRKNLTSKHAILMKKIAAQDQHPEEPTVQGPNRSYVPHSEMNIYKTCAKCGRGPGWHLPSESEIQYRLTKGGTVEVVNMVEKDQKQKQQSMPDATKDLVRLAGACTNSKMQCNGFSVARTELTPTHAALVESIETNQQRKATKGNTEVVVSPLGPNRSYLPHFELSIYKVCGNCGRGPGWHLPHKEEIEHRLARQRRLNTNSKTNTYKQGDVDRSQQTKIRISGPCCDPRVGCRGFLLYENQIYRDHLSFITGINQNNARSGRHLTEGELLDYDTLFCLDCGLGPGWHLPATEDRFSFSPIAGRGSSERRKSLHHQMKYLHRLVDGAGEKHNDGQGEEKEEWSFSDVAFTMTTNTRRDSMIERTKIHLANKRKKELATSPTSATSSTSATSPIVSTLPALSPSAAATSTTTPAITMVSGLPIDDEVRPIHVHYHPPQEEHRTLTVSGLPIDDEVRPIHVHYHPPQEEQRTPTEQTTMYENNESSQRANKIEESDVLRHRLEALDGQANLEKANFLEQVDEEKRKKRLNTLDEALKEEKERDTQWNQQMERESKARVDALHRLREKRGTFCSCTCMLFYLTQQSDLFSIISIVVNTLPVFFIVVTEQELAAVKIQGMVHRKYCIAQHRQFMEQMNDRAENNRRILMLEEENSDIFNNEGSQAVGEEPEEVSGHKEEEQQQQQLNERRVVVVGGDFGVLESSIVEDTEVAYATDSEDQQQEQQREQQQQQQEQKHHQHHHQKDDSVDGEHKKTSEHNQTKVDNTANADFNHVADDTRTQSGKSKRINQNRSNGTRMKNRKKRNKNGLSFGIKQPNGKEQPTKTTAKTTTHTATKTNATKTKYTNITGITGGKKTSKKQQFLKNHNDTNTQIPMWARHESAQVVQLRQDLRVEQTQRAMLADEIHVLRDYVMYRVEKAENKRKNLEASKKNIHTSLPQQWQSRNKKEKKKKRPRLPRLWQMPVQERYELLSKS